MAETSLSYVANILAHFWRIFISIDLAANCQIYQRLEFPHFSLLFFST